MVVHTNGARQELIQETQTSGLQGRKGTQEAVSGEWQDNMKDRVVKKKRHTGSNLGRGTGYLTSFFFLLSLSKRMPE
jgi:hypothetical protein